MTARPTILAQIEQANKLIYNYLQAVCKREEDWSSHLCTIAMGNTHCSVAGSRYFSPYFCLTGRNLTLPVDSKILKSKQSGNTVVDKFVRTLLPKLDHIRELARLKVQDFKANYKKTYDRRFQTKPTQLSVGDYVCIEQKRLKIGESAHLTPNFIGPFIISEKIGRASFKVKQCDTMKELPSPVHAERMKVAPFGSLDRFRTEKPVSEAMPVMQRTRRTNRW